MHTIWECGIEDGASSLLRILTISAYSISKGEGHREGVRLLTFLRFYREIRKKVLPTWMDTKAGL